MDTFAGRLAVITGGGAGMGSDLARMLAAEGCDVAICDVSAANLAETLVHCRAAAAPATRVTSWVADVSSEADLRAFRTHVENAHETDHIDLLFNNAGIGGGGTASSPSRSEQWERVVQRQLGRGLPRRPGLPSRCC